LLRRWKEWPGGVSVSKIKKHSENSRRVKFRGEKWSILSYLFIESLLGFHLSVCVRTLQNFYLFFAVSKDESRTRDNEKFGRRRIKRRSA